MTELGNILFKTLSKSALILVNILKAGKPVGSRSQRADGTYIKQPDGSWEKVKEPKEQGGEPSEEPDEEPSEESSEDPLREDKVIHIARTFTEEQLNDLLEIVQSEEDKELIRDAILEINR